MPCCERCFADRWLKRYFLEHSASCGDCSYCDAKGARLLPVAELAAHFDPMLGLYHDVTPDTVRDSENPLNVGDPLLNLVQDDWDVFSDRLVALGAAGTLLERIANADWEKDSGQTPFSETELYTRRPHWSHETLDEAFAGVMSGTDLDDPNIPRRLVDVFSEPLEALERATRQGEVFWRGRPDARSSEEPFCGDEIGAPPPERATPGRANRAGEPVLYLARTGATVIAELRVRQPDGPLSLCRVRTARD